MENKDNVEELLKTVKDKEEEKISFLKEVIGLMVKHQSPNGRTSLSPSVINHCVNLCLKHDVLLTVGRFKDTDMMVPVDKKLWPYNRDYELR